MYKSALLAFIAAWMMVSLPLCAQDTVACDMVPVPYFEDFESVSSTNWNVSGSLPDCWTSIWSGTDTSRAPHVIPSNGYNWIYNLPSNALLMLVGDRSGYANQSMVVLPRFSAPLYDLSLAFDYKAEYGNGHDTLKVGYCDTAGMFVLERAFHIPPPQYNSGVSRDTIDFNNVLIPNGQIMLMWENVGGDSFYGIAIDNIEVFCRPPHVNIQGAPHIEIYDTAVFTAQLVNGASTGISYSWQSAMATRGDALFLSDSDRYQIVYMSIGTDTISLVTTNLMGTDTTYTTVVAVDCSPIENLPWEENFEEIPGVSWNDVGWLPPCWSDGWNGIAAYAPHVISPEEYLEAYDWPAASVSIPDNALQMISLRDSLPAAVILPHFSQPLLGHSLAFDYRVDGTTVIAGNLMVGFCDTDGFFFPVDTLTIYGSPDHYNRDTIFFSNAFRDNVRIMLIYESRRGGYYRIVLDNFDLFRDTNFRILTLASEDSDMGTVSGSGAYHIGDTVTIYAMPNEGFRFVAWVENGTTKGAVDGDTVSFDSVYLFELTADRTLVAVFASNVRVDEMDEAPAFRITVLDGRIHVRLDDETMEFCLYDVTGRKLMHQRGSCSTPALDSGVYMVKIGNLPVQRIVVIH